METRSELARQLVNDLCKLELEGCRCCPDIILALWKRHLPGNVRSGIAHCTFNKDTFEEVVKLADDIFASNRPTTSSVAAIRSGSSAAEAALSPPSYLDETQPGIPYPVPEVSAIRQASKRSGGGG